VSTWNDLGPEYRRRVRTSIRVAIQNLLTGEEPTPTAAVTTGAISFNAAGIVGILAEPMPVLAVPSRPFGPLTTGVPIDTPEEVDPVAPVAAGTNTGAAAGTHAGTLSRSASVRCLFSAVAVLTLTIVYRRPRTLQAPPIRRWWTTAVICPMCRPTRSRAALGCLLCRPCRGVARDDGCVGVSVWSFFWSFLVGGLSFSGVYWMVFLLVVPGGWSFFWWRLLDGLSFGRFWWMVCRVYN
jgi:hypothetical protein